MKFCVAVDLPPVKSLFIYLLQECMDFCAEHNIVPKVELIKADRLDEVYTALQAKNDGVIRYILDIQASKWREQEICGGFLA